MNIEEEIINIKQRNKKVEQEKAWEISKTRKFSITMLTYFIMALVMYIKKNRTPFY